MSEFNAKLFKGQLQTLLEHHEVGKLAGTREAIVADFLDHCLQAFVRAAQDRALTTALTTALTASPYPAMKTEEEKFMDELLRTAAGEHFTPDGKPPVPAPAPVGPTLVRTVPPSVFQLDVLAGQMTIDEVSARVSAAPSPVMVQFVLNGEVQREWENGQIVEIGADRYRVIGIVPDGTLVLHRIVPSSAPAEGKG